MIPASLQLFPYSFVTELPHLPGAGSARGLNRGLNRPRSVAAGEGSREEELMLCSLSTLLSLGVSHLCAPPEGLAALGAGGAIR